MADFNKEQKDLMGYKKTIKEYLLKQAKLAKEIIYKGKEDKSIWMDPEYWDFQIVNTLINYSASLIESDIDGMIDEEANDASKTKVAKIIYAVLLNSEVELSGLEEREYAEILKTLSYGLTAPGKWIPSYQESNIIINQMDNKFIDITPFIKATTRINMILFLMKNYPLLLKGLLEDKDALITEEQLKAQLAKQCRNIKAIAEKANNHYKGELSEKNEESKNASSQDLESEDESSDEEDPVQDMPIPSVHHRPQPSRHMAPYIMPLRRPPVQVRPPAPRNNPLTPSNEFLFMKIALCVGILALSLLQLATMPFLTSVLVAKFSLELGAGLLTGVLLGCVRHPISLFITIWIAAVSLFSFPLSFPLVFGNLGLGIGLLLTDILPRAVEYLDAFFYGKPLKNASSPVFEPSNRLNRLDHLMQNEPNNDSHAAPLDRQVTILSGNRPQPNSSTTTYDVAQAPANLARYRQG